MQGINFHWLTVPQRKKLISLIKKAFNITDFHDFGKPIPGLTYGWLKRSYPQAIIGWRRYFANRQRNIKQIAWQWEPDDIEKDVINSDTKRIVGVTSEVIQKLAIRAMKERGRTKVKHARIKSRKRKRPVRR